MEIVNRLDESMMEVEKLNKKVSVLESEKLSIKKASKAVIDENNKNLIEIQIKYNNMVAKVEMLTKNRSENFVFVIDGSQTMFARAVSRVFPIIAFFDMKMTVLGGFSKI